MAVNGRFFAADGSGGMKLIGDFTGWRRTWHTVVTLAHAPFSELLFYDRVHGEAKFFSTDGNGNISLRKAHTGWRTSWDQIVPGNFGSGPAPDLFFYDRSKGEAKFYVTDGNGNITLLKAHSGLRKTWDLIVPGNFGGGEHTDLLFYDRRAGEGKIYTTDGQGNLTLLKHYTGWKKTWDLIVPGNFGGGGHTDLLFYRRIVGDAKFFTTDGAGNLTLLKAHNAWHKQWDLILPGNFSLGSFTDLVFYDRADGLGRFAATDGQGNVAELSKHDWRTSWSHIVAGELGGQIGFTDLLFYENQLRLKVHAIVCANSDGTEAVTITQQQVKQWVDRANVVYAAAGVFLDFDPASGWELLKNTTINSVGKGDDVGQQAASDYAAAYPGKVVVFFRWGPGTSRTGGGFSSGDGNFVAMPDFTATVTDMYYQDGTTKTNVQNIKLFAHELAHYLGCPHAFVSVPYYDDDDNPLFDDPNDAVLAYLNGNGGSSLDDLDNDKGYVRDTPPDVGKDYFLLNGQNPADISEEVTISSPAGGIEFTFNPDRHTVSSYFNCNDYYRVTPDQVRRIREHLMADHRKALIAGQV